MNEESIFQKFDQSVVLVVGDVMVDRYITGKIHRISPEAPVPVLNFGNEENRLGGAANVALNIKSLGARPILCSIVGKDENADIFSELLLAKNISSDFILRVDDRPTTVKTRLLADGQQVLRVDRESTDDISSDIEQLILEHIKSIFQKETIDSIILQDYNKGLLTKQLIVSIIALANEKEIPISVDPKLKNFFEYKNTTLFKPNLKEVRVATQMDVKTTLSSLRAASRHIKSILNNKITMITLSEKGIYIDNGIDDGIFPTTPRDIADVCGAGDTVISAASIALSVGMTLSEIANISNVAGGQVCEQIGIIPINKVRLFKELNSRH